MKIKEIELQNFAKYAHIDVSFDDNVTYLIGNNGAGKSTLGITAIWFMFQGIAEKSMGGNNPLIGERYRFIGSNGATAKGTMTLYDEAKGIEVKVVRKLTKSGTDLSFTGPEGMVLDQKWLTDLFNIFLIAPKKFQELSPRDQAKAIGIDTSTFDGAIVELKKEATGIRAVINQYGVITPLEKVDPVDISALTIKKSQLQQQHQADKKIITDRLNNMYLENKAANDTARKNWEEAKRNIDKEVKLKNDESDRKAEIANACISAFNTLCKHGYTGNEVKAFIEDISVGILNEVLEAQYPAEPTYIKELPESAELFDFEEGAKQAIELIDAEILAANNTNQKHLLYKQYVEKADAKAAKEKELNDNLAKQKQKEADRLTYIKGFNFPFGNLSVGEDGELLLSGKPIKEPYFSAGELIKIIPILISSSNPELKYVFLQDFNLLDEDKQTEITQYLTNKGFQLVIEYIGKKTIADKNCILLKDNVIVESYEDAQKAVLQ